MAHHILDLGLVRRPHAHHGKLDLVGGELLHVQIALGARHERRAARLAGGERGRDVLSEPHRLDACARGLEPRDDGPYLPLHLHQAMRERHVRGSGDASVGDARQARPALGHDAPSGVRQAGIDSEYGAFDGRGKPPCPLPCPPASCARRLCYKRLFVIILSHRFEERIEEAAFFHFFTALMEDPARRRTSRPMPHEMPDPARIAPPLHAQERGPPRASARGRERNRSSQQRARSQ